MNNPLLLTDFYKTIHHKCYKDGLTKLVSYWTPRMSRKEDINKVVMFGLQSFIKKYLIEIFDEHFFNRSKDEVIKEYKRIISFTMGPNYADTEHIEKLHDLGYLPIQIKAIKEGTRVPIKVPMIEITNTHDDFAWLVNYIETLMSCHIWQPMTSATIAYRYREIMNEYYNKTVDIGDVAKSCGDFSMRGMSSLESAEYSSAGHLLSFKGTATIPAIMYLEKYYDCNIENQIVGLGTPSTEHSIMCSYGRYGELEAYKNLITNLYPKGTISIVSDTYDYWNILMNLLPELKKEILNRDGKVVIRGDSGDPVKIICGSIDIEEDPFLNLSTIKEWYRDKAYSDFNFNIKNSIYEKNEFIYYCRIDNKTYKVSCKISTIDMFYSHIRKIEEEYNINNLNIGFKYEEVELTPEQKGTVELLWDTFGGHINSKGYKVLNKNIGAIYGDSITIERAEEICKKLEQKGFAVNNCTLGIGSYTYQYNTRDTFGFALKATHAIINGVETQIYKDPKTDDGNFKRSQRGMCYVYKENDNILYKDGLTIEEQENSLNNLLELVFLDGKLLKSYSLSEIRNTLHSDI